MNICVFAGSSSGRRPVFREAAAALGQEIASRGLGLVYGGASVGLMGAVADAALAAGGAVTGVLPRTLAEVEITHNGLTELLIVESMHERKAIMADLSAAFIALPGGIGTLEEAFEVWTWSQLGIHSKPIGLLNVDGFYDRLTGFLDQLVEDQFVRDVHRRIMHMDAEPARLLDLLQHAEVPRSRKWIDELVAKELR
ncbi:MAG: TIGR00730 family Rossman fold protein [Pseudomonadota bacterium]